MAPLPGQTVSHYKILTPIGGGGMGVVYKAQDLKLDRPAALKFLSPDLTCNAEARERFVHEAKAASSLDHPNICTVYEIGETEDGQVFLAMACYDGETLNTKIERGPLPIEHAVDITLQVAQGLAKAHEAGIVHRDIKPANIMLTNDGTAKILDFGLAKVSGRTLHTRAGLTLGTAAYMSPEQARSESTDARTDLWSLGVVLYEMLTGRRPFESSYEQALVYSILNDEPKAIRQVRPEVPESLERIVCRAMEKRPELRYQSASDLVADLDAMRSGSRAPAAPRPWSARVRVAREEITSRRVIPALAAYALASWAILQGVDLLVNRFHVPASASRVMLVLLVCGAPTSLVMAWYHGQPGRQHLRRKEMMLYALNLVVALAAVIGIWLSPAGPGRADIYENSIAILYIKNLGAETDEAYSYGITQDLIVDVAKAGLVRVAPMKDVLSVRTAELPIDKLASQLRVRYVLDGSLRREGNLFRLTAQIVEAATGATLWADHIQTSAAEATKLQGKLAAAIIGAIKLTPSDLIAREITAARASNPDAYELYLRANYLFETKKNKEDVLVSRGLYEKAFRTDSTLIDAWLGYGRTFEVEGQPTVALTSFERAQAIARALDDSLGEAKSLLRLASIRLDQSEFSLARDYYTQSLAFARRCGDRDGETRSLIGIGDVAFQQGDFMNAHEQYGQARRVAQTVGDRRLEANLLYNDASVSYYQGDNALALASFTASYGIYKELGDMQPVSMAVTGMAMVWEVKQEYDSALTRYGEALTIVRTLGDRAGEANVLCNMALAYMNKRDFSSAAAGYQQSIEIARSVHDRMLEAHALLLLGELYSRQEQYGRAIECLQQGLAASREIGSRRQQAFALSFLGQMYYRQAELTASLQHLSQAAEIRHELRDSLGEGRSLANIGQAYNDLGLYEIAAGQLNHALRLMRQVGDQQGEIPVQLSLGEACMGLGRTDDALEHYNRSLALAEATQAVPSRGEALAAIGMWHLTRRNLPEALNALGRADSAIQLAGDKEASALISARLGLASAEAGARDRATFLVQRAADSMATIASPLVKVQILWGLYRSAVALGDAHQAARSLDTARALLQAVAAKIADPAMRKSYLGRNTINCALIAAWRKRSQ